MFYNAYVSHQLQLVVLWSPKCACTSAVEWFFSLAPLNYDGVEKVKRRWLAHNGYLYNYIQAIHLVEDLGYKSVQFTRDPYTRSISAYLNKFCVYRNKPLTKFHELEPFAKNFIRSFNSIRNVEPTEFIGISFFEYLKHVKHLMNNHNAIDQHWDSQLPRYVPNRIKPDAIVRQENFESDLEYANGKLSLNGFIPDKKNVTSWPDDFQFVSSNEGNTNSLLIIQGKKRLKNENLLNKRTIQLINEIYNEDFNFFKYPYKNKGIIERFFPRRDK